MSYSIMLLDELFYFTAKVANALLRAVNRIGIGK